MKTPEAILDELQARRSRMNTIVQGLEGNDAFNMLLEDARQSEKMCDDAWHLCREDRELEMLRVTKMATRHILSVLDRYKGDMRQIDIEIAKMENKEDLVNKDYDEA